VSWSSYFGGMTSDTLPTTWFKQPGTPTRKRERHLTQLRSVCTKRSGVGHLTYRDHDIECSGQASARVVVTPEMIAAGRDALAGFNEEFDDARDAVVWIYEAMEMVRRRTNQENQ
jgi:hypothetical protein